VSDGSSYREKIERTVKVISERQGDVSSTDLMNAASNQQ